MHIIVQQSDLCVDCARVEELTKQVIALENQTCDEVSIHLVDEPSICALHAEFFNDPSPTDTISFPLDSEDEPGHRILGDVFACPLTAVKYAKQHNLDPCRELTLYIVHGLLHLLGYDDLDPPQRKRMRAAEKRHMLNLQKRNLIASST